MTDFAADLLEYRARKDDFFRGPHSPLKEGRAAFSGLAYFAPDPAHRVVAEVTPGNGEVVELATTTGQPRHFTRFGTASFDLPEGPATLTLFAAFGDDSPSQVFVPFRDATSGTETYETGRYLEGQLHDGLVILDFNLAYFPYCAYGDGWTCPVPPAENRLAVPVRAGEKLT